MTLQGHGALQRPPGPVASDRAVPRRRLAIPDRASRTIRLARKAVTWPGPSYAGDSSTTSRPTTGSSRAQRRTASSSWRLVRPPGSGVPVPGAMPGSTTSTGFMISGAALILIGTAAALMLTRTAPVAESGRLATDLQSAPAIGAGDDGDGYGGRVRVPALQRLGTRLPKRDGFPAPQAVP